jgi:(2Fe-2S) ferredoxin
VPIPEKHFFVCTNRRPPGVEVPSCGAQDGFEILAALREERDRRGLAASVFITATGCLGPCPAKGGTVVVYPDGSWYTGLSIADVPEIGEQHMAGGKPVSRLLDKEFSRVE